LFIITHISSKYNKNTHVNIQSTVKNTILQKIQDYKNYKKTTLRCQARQRKRTECNA